MRQQQTVARAVQLRGVGLHHGQSAELTIEPAPAGSGLVFTRDDLGGEEVPALQQYRADMIHATRLARGEALVDTPEHLLAALYALQIDNARLRLSSAEVPILDGSSLPIAEAILEAGIEPQRAERSELVITRTVGVGDEDRRLEIQPGDGLRLTAAIDFDHPELGYQDLTVRVDRIDDFLAKLAPARTFALERDVEKLRSIGLAQGGSLDNAVVVGDRGLLGGDLRYPDEFVRHKLLDLVGDLALLGCDLRGRVVAWRSGHELHGRLVDAILSDRSAWIFDPAAGESPDPPSRPAPPGPVKVG